MIAHAERHGFRMVLKLNQCGLVFRLDAEDDSDESIGHLASSIVTVFTLRVQFFPQLFV
jgi:hypothetical protein